MSNVLVGRVESESGGRQIPDRYAYSWLLRTDTPIQSIKVAVIAGNLCFLHCSASTSSPLFAVISPAPDQLMFHGFTRLIACCIRGMDLWATNRTTDVHDIHRFWGSYNLGACVAPVTKSKTSLICSKSTHESWAFGCNDDLVESSDWNWSLWLSYRISDIGYETNNGEF